MPETFDFGEALRRLRAGKHVCRVGWNGRAMWLSLQAGYPEGIPINKNTSDATGLPAGTVCRFTPYLMLRTEPRDRLQEENRFTPWHPSQDDMLEEDWMEATKVSGGCAPAEKG